jgi:hypothetical protein
MFRLAAQTAKAYDTLAVRLHGANAKLNFKFGKVPSEDISFSGCHVVGHPEARGGDGGGS